MGPAEPEEPLAGVFDPDGPGIPLGGVSAKLAEFTDALRYVATPAMLDDTTLLTMGTDPNGLVIFIVWCF